MIKVEFVNEIFIVLLVVTWAKKNPRLLVDDSRKACSDKVEGSSHRLFANGFDLNLNSEDETCHEHSSIDVHRCFCILKFLQFFEGRG